VAWALCFGREAWVVAPWLALAPLFLLLSQPRSTRLALLHGVAFWLAAVPWIAPTVTRFGGLPGWLGPLLLLALAGYLGSYHALFALAGARLWRRGGLLAVVGVAALWTALEVLRGLLLGGFPWNLTAYAWVEVPGALELSSWLGAFGVTFVAALANAGLARAVERRRLAPWLWSAGTVLVLLAGAARWGGPGAAPRGEATAAPARLMQPNIPIRGGADSAAIATDYAGLLDLSRQACDEPGALLVWPESATWPLAWQTSAVLRRDVESLAADCPVLLNSAFYEKGKNGGAGGRTFNSALLVDTTGVVGRYDKRHLVPFGEEVPGWAAWIPGVPALARAAGHFGAGSEVRLLPWRDERLAVSICFEITFPSEVAEGVRSGATTLVTLTNDAWYGDTSAPWQHFRAARFRAAENHRPVLRAATTGVSGWIDATGRVRSLLGPGERGVLSHRVAGRQELTAYTRAPWVVPVLCWLFAAFAILRTLREPDDDPR
jgi:apolipoprotein N-acyltransferase